MSIVVTLNVGIRRVGLLCSSFFQRSESPRVTLKLKKPKNDKKVNWKSGTVDNEHMNKKKSKCKKNFKLLLSLFF